MARRRSFVPECPSNASLEGRVVLSSIGDWLSSQYRHVKEDLGISHKPPKDAAAGIPEVVGRQQAPRHPGHPAPRRRHPPPGGLDGASGEPEPPARQVSEGRRSLHDRNVGSAGPPGSRSIRNGVRSTRGGRPRIRSAITSALAGASCRPARLWPVATIAFE